MSRTRARALVLVNWKGVFYERYLIDRHVTALEGTNGAGKTTVMIAAYVVLLPDMSRLRFTNLGETGATGGDKGIWGRLGEAGRPAYSAIDFALAGNRRLLAGVHLERKSEPSIEPTPFIISDLDADIRLQDVLLLSQGNHEVVPELSELRENAARVGGRMQVFGTARDYFAALFEHGVTPLRLGTDEERGKFNEMLRTSMTGGISRALTSGLRSFLLKEESGLADTLQRMKANLDACRRTRTEVQESQRLEQEIGGVFESGQRMFAAAFLATRERADEMRRRLAEAEQMSRKARQQLEEAEDLLNRVSDELNRKGARREALIAKLNTTEQRVRGLRLALEAAQEVARRHSELSSAEDKTQVAAEERAAKKELYDQCRANLRSREEDHKRASAGLADLQSGLDELHRRAGTYRQVVRRKSEAERLLGIDDLSVSSIAGRMAQSKAGLEQVDRARREAKRRSADAKEHRLEHAAALAALERLADAPIAPGDAHPAALDQLRRFRDLQSLAEQLSTVAAQLAEVRTLASRQAEARGRLEKLGLTLSGKRSAGDEIAEHLERAEREHEQFLEQERNARSDIADCQRTLDSFNTRQKELGDREPTWRELATRAAHLADKLDRSVASLPELQAVRDVVGHRLTEAKAREASLVKLREGLHAEARELMASRGPFDAELLRLKDALGADLLASAFEDVSLEDAGVLEARLGPLVQALVVDDPVKAAAQVHDRSESLPEVWFVDRNEDAELLGAAEPGHDPESADVVVAQLHATRVTRIPARPRLGRKARENRAAQLRAEADELDVQIEAARADRRGLGRLAADGEALLVERTVWLSGDPAPELAAIRRQFVEVEAQQEIHRGASSHHRQAALELEPRIEALRSLLGMAMLLDPPDHAHRRDLLARQYDAAVCAQTEVRRSADAAREVEDRLDALRRLPLSEAEAVQLESELERLSAERGRLDAAIEALEYVSANSEALRWDDAPKQLEENRSLVPALEEQLRRAEAARGEAETSAQAATREFERATATWQDADGYRRAAVEQHRAAEKRFAELGILEPTEAAVEDAQREFQQLQDEERVFAGELDVLKTTMGRREAEKEQAERDCKAAQEKVADERGKAAPALERWERLRSAVAEHNLPTTVLPPGDSDLDGNQEHVNLEQEAHKQRAVLNERLRAAHGAQDLLAQIDKKSAGIEQAFSDVYLDLWLAVRDWLRRRLPAQVSEVDDPQEALLRLRDQLTGLEERLARQEDDLRGASEDVARGIDVQIRKARGQVNRLNKNLASVSFGSIDGIQVKLQPVERMGQVLRALRKGAVQGLLFQENLPIEEALNEIFRRYGGGQTVGYRLLDYREYVHMEVEVRRNASSSWEIANPTRLSTGEAIGVGAALMMVVLTEWERDGNLLRGKRSHGSLRFLFLDEANRLSHDNLGVLFDLCQTLDLQLLIAAPEVAKADGNTTYRLVRRVDANGREEVLVSGRRTRVGA